MQGDTCPLSCDAFAVAENLDNASPTVLVDMAIEALQDIITTADLLQQGIVAEAPEVEMQKLRETAHEQFASYLDFKERAARAVRDLKP